MKICFKKFQTSLWTKNNLNQTHLACCTKKIIIERNTISSMEGRSENHGETKIWLFLMPMKERRIVSKEH